MPTATMNEAAFTKADYDREAAEYLASLPMEHFMESTWQSIQRAIVNDAFDIICKEAAAIHYFAELLVQYWVAGALHKVVPDGMVVLGDLLDEMRTSYNVALEQIGLFMALEYVSASNERKDYDENFEKYEQELKVPYYVLFHPEKQDLQIYQHNGVEYERVAANQEGRYPVARLELEIGVLDGWMRFWHRGELLELPHDLVLQVRELKQSLQESKQQLEQKDQELHQKDQQLHTLLYRLVQREAQAANRDDILAAINQQTPTAQLEQWLAEF